MPHFFSVCIEMSETLRNIGWEQQQQPSMMKKEIIETKEKDVTVTMLKR
jgi:hypothetical protein